MPPLQRFVIALTGGLQDSKSIPDPSDMVQLYNFGLFRGRFGLRAPVEEIQTIGTTETAILHMTTHLNKIWILTWNSGTQTVNLYSQAWETPTSGGWPAETLEKSAVYGSITTRPNMFLTSFSGGSADAPEDRLYICDYDQNEVTKYWVESTTTLETLTEDLDADNSAEDVYFSLITPYQFHLWGTGFYADIGASPDPDKLRPEMLRFSQPGLIPNVDPAGGTPSSKEWFTFGHRSVGRRGDKIRALSYAAGNMMVFQSGSTHAIFGYGQDSWATKQLSDHIGCVGPRAAVASDTDGLCYFWSHDGPFMTDGTQVVPIGEDIRQHIIDHPTDQRVSAAYSPEDTTVYFTLFESGQDVDVAGLEPGYYLAYDTERRRWCDGSWERSGGAIPVSCMITATSREIAEAPGPQGAPTSLSGSYVQEIASTGQKVDRVTLTWTSKEFALDATTEVWRDTSTFTVDPPGQGTKVLTLAASKNTAVSSQTLTQTQPYYFCVIHMRNGTYSARSNTAGPFTIWCDPPTVVTASARATGIEWRIGVPDGPTGGADVMDIELQRAPVGTEGEGDWYTPVILNDIAESQTYTYSGDTSNYTENQEYRLRARIEDINNLGETPSAWRYATVNVTPDTGSDTEFSLGTAAYTLRTVSPGLIRYIASCPYSDASPGVDTVRIYVNDGGGMPSEPTVTMPTRSISAGALWKSDYTCPRSGSVSVKFEAWVGNADMVDSSTTTPVDICSGIEY
jgi:hypothetical protein